MCGPSGNTTGADLAQTPQRINTNTVLSTLQVSTNAAVQASRLSHHVDPGCRLVLSPVKEGESAILMLNVQVQTQPSVGFMAELSNMCMSKRRKMK